jgi:hypothetical protein
MDVMEEVAGVVGHFRGRGAVTGAPVGEEGILRAEGALGVRLPGVLRALYRVCDGIWEEGKWAVLYPLVGERSLVTETRELWRQAEVFSWDVRAYVQFGGNGATGTWLMRHGEGGGGVEMLRMRPCQKEETGLGVLGVYLAAAEEQRELRELRARMPEVFAPTRSQLAFKELVEGEVSEERARRLVEEMLEGLRRKE